MGHLINPISLRLGKSVFWKFSWSSFLKKNYRYLLLQDIQFILFFEWLLSKNMFYRYGLMFSHFRIFRLNKKVVFFIYFVKIRDFIQSKHVYNKLKKKSLYGISKKKRQEYSFRSFSENKVSHNFYNFFKLFLVIFYLKNKALKNNLKKLNILHNKFKFNLFLLNKNLFKICFQIHFRFFEMQNLTLFFNILIYFLKNNLDFKFVTAKKFKKGLIFSKKFKYSKKLYLKLYFLSFRYRMLTIFRFIFFKGYTYIQKKNKQTFPFLLFVRFLDKKSSTKTAYLIGRTIIELMKYKKIPLRRAIDLVTFNLFRQPKSLQKIIGYKIVVAGRLTRNTRAMYVTVKHGKVPLNTLNLPIDYSAQIFKTRFGVCGLKIWLNKSVPLNDSSLKDTYGGVLNKISFVRSIQNFSKIYKYKNYNFIKKSFRYKKFILKLKSYVLLSTKKFLYLYSILNSNKIFIKNRNSHLKNIFINVSNFHLDQKLSEFKLFIKSYNEDVGSFAYLNLFSGMLSEGIHFKYKKIKNFFILKKNIKRKKHLKNIVKIKIKKKKNVYTTKL